MIINVLIFRKLNFKRYETAEKSNLNDYLKSILITKKKKKCFIYKILFYQLISFDHYFTPTTKLINVDVIWLY